MRVERRGGAEKEGGREEGQEHGCLLLFLGMEGGIIDQWRAHEAGQVTKYKGGWRADV